MLYILILSIELFFIVGFTLFTLYLIYSDYKGSPFVPSKDKEIEIILREANLKEGQKFADLGCGDGRVVRHAAKSYKMRAVGIDINPILIYYAKFITRLKKIKNAEFLAKDIFAVNLNEFNVVYLFLMPKTISRLVAKFKSELKKGSYLISHGFEIKDFKSKLYKKIPNSPFPTYFYKI